MVINVSKIKQDFIFFKNHPNVIYFDSAATTLKPKSTIDAELKYYYEYGTNTHNSDSNLSFMTNQVYENARVVVKEFINAKSEKEIVFTSGATHSINQIAFGLKESLNPGDEILLNYLEHSSNLLPWFEIAKLTGAVVKFIPLLNGNEVDWNRLNNVLSTKTKVVAFADLNNTFGYKTDVKMISTTIKNYNPNIVVVVDCAQGVAHHKINVNEWNIDFCFFSAHKIFGPLGTGVLYGKMDSLSKLKPIFYGGGMVSRIKANGDYILKEIPWRFEAGTPNIAGVFGMVAGIKYLNSIGYSNIELHEKELKKYFVKQAELILKNKIIIYNSDNNSGTAIFNIKNVYAQDVATHLGSINNIIVRSGDHCVKLIDKKLINNAVVRASFYVYNDKNDLDILINSLKEETFFLGNIARG